MQLVIASVLLLCIGLSAALPGIHFTLDDNVFKQQSSDR